MKLYTSVGISSIATSTEKDRKRKGKRDRAPRPPKFKGHLFAGNIDAIAFFQIFLLSSRNLYRPYICKTFFVKTRPYTRLSFDAGLDSICTHTDTHTVYSFETKKFSYLIFFPKISCFRDIRKQFKAFECTHCAGTRSVQRLIVFQRFSVSRSVLRGLSGHLDMDFRKIIRRVIRSAARRGAACLNSSRQLWLRANRNFVKRQ